MKINVTNLQHFLDRERSSVMVGLVDTAVSNLLNGELIPIQIAFLSDLGLLTITDDMIATDEK